MTTPPNASNSANEYVDPDGRFSLYEEFGVSEKFMPEEGAPPVDRALLARLARKDLPPDQADHALTLTALFRSWHEAYADELVKALTPAAERAPAASGIESWLTVVPYWEEVRAWT